MWRIMHINNQADFKKIAPATVKNYVLRAKIVAKKKKLTKKMGYCVEYYLQICRVRTQAIAAKDFNSSIYRNF